MENIPSVDSIESAHTFPGVYQIKAIGLVDDDFEGRVVKAVVGELSSASELEYSGRTTPAGRHVSLTLHVSVQSAEQVRRIYAKIHEIKGLTLLL